MNMTEILKFRKSDFLFFKEIKFLFRRKKVQPD